MSKVRVRFTDMHGEEIDIVIDEPRPHILVDARLGALGEMYRRDRKAHMLCAEDFNNWARNNGYMEDIDD